MPSRLRTPRPPSLPSSIAVCGETTPSIAEAISGSSSRCGPSFQPMSTSCGSRVLRDGTIAMSSKPYACRAFFPRPISISTDYLPSKRICRTSDCAAEPHRSPRDGVLSRARTFQVRTLPASLPRNDQRAPATSAISPAPLMHKGPGAVVIAWAKKPFSPPSLKCRDASTAPGRKRSACGASRQHGPRWRSRPGSVADDRRELGPLDGRHEAPGLARLEAAGADLERRGGSRRDGAAERLLVRAALEPGGEGGG